MWLNTTVFTSSSERNLDAHIASLGTAVTDAQSDVVHGILAGTKSGNAVLTQFAPDAAQRLEALVRDAFVAGLHTAFRMDTALALGGLLVAVLFVGGGVKHERLHQLRRWHHHASGGPARGEAEA